MSPLLGHDQPTNYSTSECNSYLRELHQKKYKENLENWGGGIVLRPIKPIYMNKNLKFASAFLGLFFVLSCTKTSAPVPGEKNMTTAIKKENYTTANSENSRYGSEAVLLNRGENVNTDLASFFRSYDTNILKSFRYEIAGPMMADENPANVQYMINKNAELINILSLINPVSFSSEEMSVNDEIVS